MGKGDDIHVEKGVNLHRFMGSWYQIAALQTPIFEPNNGTNTRTTYSLQEDGATINVLNVTWVAGKRNKIEGIAYKTDPNNNEAKFKIKFYVPPFLPIIPITGDYWILYLDHDYHHAVIGNPSRKSLWILSRKNQIEEETYNKLARKAMNEGYDVSKLRRTPQTNPSPEGDDKHTKGGISVSIAWIKSKLGL